VHPSDEEAKLRAFLRGTVLSRWRGFVARPVEDRVLPEDRGFQVVQRPARLDPELFDEVPSRVAVRGERLRLSTRSIQRPHELAAEAFAQWVLPDERLELGHQVAVPAEGELRLDSLLECEQALLLEPRTLRLAERFVGEFRERRAAPETESLAERRRARRYLPVASASRPSATARSNRCRSRRSGPRSIT
jgi:hypothetical protein